MAQAFRSTRVVTPEGVRPATVLVDAGKITAIHLWDAHTPGAILHDFGDLVLLPGLVDTHVHINDPGRDWEGFGTATRAAASGGVTTLVDMPLNCIPETITAAALEEKRAAARHNAWTDWAAWGGVVHGNADEIPELIAAGVHGFKCFLIHSGIEGFAWVDESDLRAALTKLEGTNLPLLAHAELKASVEAATAKLSATNADWRLYSTWLTSRPDSSEVEAIRLLIQLAEEFQTPIHIVHLSSAEALPLLAEARQRGLPITVETCPHYLWFAAEEIPDGATEYKCAPPIRSAQNREALWQALFTGLIDFIATDHSPCPPAMKNQEEGRFDSVWGGVASLGLAISIIWTGILERNFNHESALIHIAEWLAAAPARLAGLHSKGALRPGADADFAIFDPDITWTVTESGLNFRHKISPYLGASLRGRILETWLGGEKIYANGTWSPQPHGKDLTKP
ncbi:allantoinase AllB [Terracidiphilus gabretensis]|uniref:allantoinase AllB n=1 Tax=Terracidiphilus gabretensis TaxID=1577687 RepID=UPI00071B92FC|nr:allantoinase AllB [Terracidiphilus gabretensis]